MTGKTGQDIEHLRERWNELYKRRLPALAKARDPVQTTWPVFLDHCFARIILDNAIGKDRPWTEIIKQPAVKNMSEDQLKTAIKLAERLASGKADLVALDEQSLELRGKRSKKRKGEDHDPRHSSPKKRKPDTGTISSYFLPSPSSPPKSNSHSKPPNTKPVPKPSDPEVPDPSAIEQPPSPTDLLLHRIATSTLTPFRKQTLSLLCQIPRGQYTTYAALADHISRTSHKTCARAVGNAMRHNPFAPAVPGFEG
ncbi:hypothetical protein NU219Hw_g8452t1 [Hortaea werneckii]